MKPIILITALLFLLSSCLLDQPYYDDGCYTKRVRIYDKHGKYKGHTEERVCE